MRIRPIAVGTRLNRNRDGAAPKRVYYQINHTMIGTKRPYTALAAGSDMMIKRAKAHHVGSSAALAPPRPAQVTEYIPTDLQSKDAMIEALKANCFNIESLAKANHALIEVMTGKTSMLNGKTTYHPHTTGKAPPVVTADLDHGTAGDSFSVAKNSSDPKYDAKQNGCKWETPETEEWMLHDGKSKETLRKYKKAVDDLYSFLIRDPESTSVLNSPAASACDTCTAPAWFTFVDYTALLKWRAHVVETASRSTKQPRVAAVKSLFKYLTRRRHIDEDPSRDLRLPPKAAKSTVIRYLTPGQIQRAITSAQNITGKYSAVALIAGTYHGMLRKKEVRRIRRSDCAFVKDDDGTELLRIRVVGKGRDEKERYVTLSQTGTELLRPIVRMVDSEYLLPGRSCNTPMSSSTAYRVIKRVFKDAELPSEASPHWLRHAGASHAHKNGATLAELRDMLGHSDIKVTSRYLHNHPGTSCARALDL